MNTNTNEIIMVQFYPMNRTIGYVLRVAKSDISKREKYYQHICASDPCHESVVIEFPLSKLPIYSDFYDFDKIKQLCMETLNMKWT